MNTQTHFLVAAALFARPNAPRRNIAWAVGAFLPDLAIFGLFAWALVTGTPQNELWSRIYFSEPMLTLTAIANSAPLYVAIALLGWFWAQARAGKSVDTLPALTVLGLAALSHLAGDLPVHVDDAHPHFWPLTDWRFRSPISYWDGNHYGREFSLFEALLGIGLAVFLWRRFASIWFRALLALCIAAYLIVPLFWWLQFGG
ncbi:MAG: cobalamin biosynthesis protein CobQ [Pseudomonadota bacterium]